METKRTQILSIIQRRDGASVDELAEELGLASATVRRHLDILQRDGLVGFVEAHGGVGRPRYVYSLTHAGQELLPREYSRLAQRFMHEVADLGAGELKELANGKSLVDLVIRRIADSKAEQYAGQLAGQDFDGAVQGATRILNQEHYAADAQEVPGGYRIRLHNCPYQEVADSHHELCSLETEFVRSLVKCPVAREATMVEGAASCVLLVQRPTAPVAIAEAQPPAQRPA
ncbi:MAG: winged helix-turn-helix transcriptional regulator [Dehalococcoidia bacterium]|nr:winged helix-turn-helix transcriptional regulator [Dehalococcoidia bacterium]